MLCLPNWQPSGVQPTSRKLTRSRCKRLSAWDSARPDLGGAHLKVLQTFLNMSTVAQRFPVATPKAEAGAKAGSKAKNAAKAPAGSEPAASQAADEAVLRDFDFTSVRHLHRACP